MVNKKITIIPSVKRQDIKDEFLRTKAIYYEKNGYDDRLLTALEKLPYDQNGVELVMRITGDVGEGYELCVKQESIMMKQRIQLSFHPSH